MTDENTLARLAALERAVEDLKSELRRVRRDLVVARADSALARADAAEARRLLRGIPGRWAAWESNPEPAD